MLCSWLIHLTLSLPYSCTQVYKWIPANLMLGFFRWTGVLSRGDRNIPFRFMLQKIQRDQALGSNANLPCLPSVEEVLKIHTVSEFNF